MSNMSKSSETAKYSDCCCKPMFSYAATETLDLPCESSKELPPASIHIAVYRGEP